jgi:hypothetical protein
MGIQGKDWGPNTWQVQGRWRLSQKTFTLCIFKRTLIALSIVTKVWHGKTPTRGLWRRPPEWALPVLSWGSVWHPHESPAFPLNPGLKAEWEKARPKLSPEQLGIKDRFHVLEDRWDVFQSSHLGATRSKHEWRPHPTALCWWGGHFATRHRSEIDPASRTFLQRLKTWQWIWTQAYALCPQKRSHSVYLQEGSNTQ